MMKKIFSILTLFVTLVAITSCSEDDNTPALSSLNSITSFKINFEGVNEDEITYDLGNEITVSVPFKTELKGLKPIIEVSENATVSPASGEAVDFEDGVAKPFVVTAEDETTKTYNVTINVRGEVGSGTQLNTSKVITDFGAFKDEIVTTYEYTSANFVSKYVVNEGGVDSEYIVIYDDKNQVIEVKNEADKLSTTYVYNVKGEIESAKTEEDGTAIFTLVYTYDDKGQLTKSVRTKVEDGTETVNTFEYDDSGNVTKQTLGTEEYTVTTYDANPNPFVGIYPKAYSAIRVGITGVAALSVNNPTEATFADTGSLNYIYNTDNYPEKVTHTIFGGFYTVEANYTYN